LLGPWNDLKKIAGQIKEISPVLLEPDIEQKFSIKQGGSNPIYSRLYKKDTDYYLIAANSTIDPTAACFKMEGLRDNTEAKEFYNNTKIYSKEDELTLEFGSYEVLVYKMKLDRYFFGGTYDEKEVCWDNDSYYYAHGSHLADGIGKGSL